MPERAALLTVAAQVEGNRQRLVVVGDLDRPPLGLCVVQVMVVLFERHRQIKQLPAICTPQAKLAVHLAQGEPLVAEILLELVEPDVL